MPAQSTLTSDEKSKVKAAIPTNANKIHTAALARIYYAHPQPNEWSYAGLQGALAFVTDKSRNALIMKMVDLTGTRGLIWEHELYEGFEYFQDRPFFQSFAGDVSRHVQYAFLTIRLGGYTRSWVVAHCCMGPVAVAHDHHRGCWCLGHLVHTHILQVKAMQPPY